MPRSAAKSLPDFVEPMLAVLIEPFESAAHLYEFKWDGFRALAFNDANGLRILGRRGTDFTQRFPELGVLDKLPRGTVLDGEIVHMTGGKPDFTALLKRERSWSGSSPAKRSARGHAAVTFVAFDLLYEKHASLLDRPLSDRRPRLEKLLAAHASGRLALSEGIVGGGLALFEEVKRRELEGVIAKRLDSRYEPGQRSGAWTKFKRRVYLDCVVIGYLPSAKFAGVKSLIIAADVEGEPRCVGQVGSGLNEVMQKRLMAVLPQLRQPQPVVPCDVKGAYWLWPKLTCRVSFAEWTDAGKLRQPVLEALHET